MVISPCNHTCKLNQQKICIGCGRTVTEIICWKELTDAQKISIIKRIKK